MAEKKGTPNYKAFIPIGTTFLGAGVVFLIAVSPGIGAALIAVGALWMVIGAVQIRKDQDPKNGQKP